MALGTDTTLNMLEDPERRPPTPIIEIHREMMEHWPVEDFALDPDKFARNLRSARKGAAPGPSGMTSEHLRPLLGQVRQVLIEAIRVGRMTVLQKPDGGASRSTPSWSDARRLSSTPSRHVLELSVCRTHCKPSQRQSWRRQ